jgi:hypothetical protein
LASGSKRRRRKYGRRRKHFGAGWATVSVLIVIAAIASIVYISGSLRGPRLIEPAPLPTAADAQPAEGSADSALPDASAQPAQTQPAQAAAEDAQSESGAGGAPGSSDDADGFGADFADELASPAPTPEAGQSALYQPKDISEDVQSVFSDSGAPAAQALDESASPPDEDAAPPPQAEAPAGEPYDDTHLTTSQYSDNQWPAQQFPEIIPFESASYGVIIENGRADIYLAAGSDAGFADYAAALIEKGAIVHLDNEMLTVLVLGDTEIQLIPNFEMPLILLCAEPQIDWANEAYPLPQTGRLVSAEPIIGSAGTALIYRCVSFADLIDYTEYLEGEGWSADPAEPMDGALFTTYRRDAQTIAIDYYAFSTNFEISLEGD